MQQRLGVARLEVGERPGHRAPAAEGGSARDPMRPPPASVNRPPLHRLAARLACCGLEPHRGGYRADVASHALSSPRSALALLAPPARRPSRSTCCTSTTSTAASSSINAFDFDLLGRGRGGGRMLRRRGAAEDRDRRGCARSSRAGGGNVAGARRRRRLPGLAVLHHRAGAGRGRDAERHRRSTRWSTATTSSTSGRSRWRSSSRRPSSRCSRATSTSRATTCWRRCAEDHLVLDVGGEKVGDPRRDHARHRRDLLARADRELPRSGRLSDRPGRGAGGRGRRQDHPAVAPRGRRRHRGRRGGAGHRR